MFLHQWKERIWALSLTPLTITLPRFARLATIIFVICDEFTSSLVLTLQYFWQMLWSVVIWTTTNFYLLGSSSNIAKPQRECSLPYRFQIWLNESWYTLFEKTPVASNLTSCTCQMQFFGFQGNYFSQPLYLSPLIRSSSLIHGNSLSNSSTRPKKHIGRCDFTVATSGQWNRLPQTVISQETINEFRR